MPEDNDKILPKDSDSDYSLPGRFEESNSDYFVPKPIKSKPKNKSLLIIVLSFVIVSSVFFSYYFMNQDEIDSQIIQNTINMTPEQKLLNSYTIGEYGSDHVHVAITVFVNGEQINFGMPQFQLSSKYIHFENNNPYLIHKHATGVPLEMLFTSFGMKIASDCIMLNYDESVENKSHKFCTEKGQSLVYYVNGEQYYDDISQYVLEHNDRILVSLGDTESISEQLAYLESLKIFDIPKKIPQSSGNEILI